MQSRGKVRGQVEVATAQTTKQSGIEKLAKKEKNVVKYLKGKKIKKVVFVKGKLINFVV